MAAEHEVAAGNTAGGPLAAGGDGARVGTLDGECAGRHTAPH